MRPRLLKQPGFTLIEMVIAVVTVGIVVAATIFFAYPLRQAVDTTVRAELTDTGDNALQRIAREVHLALPNSVRVDSSSVPGSSFIEFIPVRTAGRYRAVSSGALCAGAGTDELAFDAADSCFKTIGVVPDAGSVTNSDFLVFNNYGPGFTDQDAYAASANPNRRKVVALTDEGGVREQITFDTSGGLPSLSGTLHDSPGKRFFVVPGNGAAPLPISYECTPPNLWRWSGYAATAAQPTPPGGPRTLLATNVTACNFDYESSGVGPRIGLLTLQISLAKPVSTGNLETVTLYHAVHISNVP
jgi:MSHA biogenesis protein MshO